MSKWTSRKFLVAVAGLGVVIMVNLGLDEATALKITDTVLWLATAYLGAEGAADVVTRFKE